MRLVDYTGDISDRYEAREQRPRMKPGGFVEALC